MFAFMLHFFFFFSQRLDINGQLKRAGKLHSCVHRVHRPQVVFGFTYYAYTHTVSDQRLILPTAYSINRLR